MMRRFGAGGVGREIRGGRAGDRRRPGATGLGLLLVPCLGFATLGLIATAPEAGAAAARDGTPVGSTFSVSSAMPARVSDPQPGPVVPAPGADGPPPPSGPPARVATARIAGVAAPELSVALSRRAFPRGAVVAYLARAQPLTDALVAGQLIDGPVLLVAGGGASAAVVGEIRRLRPREVIAIGGVAAVPNDMLVSAAGGRRTARVGGATAVDTARLIARRAHGPAPRAGVPTYVVGRAGIADGAVAGQLTEGPVVLAPPPGTPPARPEPAGPVFAIGGPGVVSEAALRALSPSRARAGDFPRLAGPDRYATAAAVAAHAFPNGADTVYLASGVELAGAVAAGALTDGAVLLAPRCGTLPRAVGARIAALRPSHVVAVGGSALVCEAIVGQARRAALAG